MKTVLSIAFILAATAAGFAQDTKSTTTCGGCHAREATEHAASSHGTGQVGCADCHGGDPLALAEKDGHAKNFRGKLSRRDIPAMCADCHSDARRMHAFGISTEQFKLYSISKHGESVLRGVNESAAVCSDCHGAHSALPPTDARSSVAPQKLSATCDKCHADPALMEKPKIDVKISKEYAASVHGKALAAGNVNAPTCAGCHGSHAASAPGAATVGDTCGKCHAAQRDAFHASAHGIANQKTGQVRCVECHGAHGIQKAETLDVKDTCAKCHDLTKDPNSKEAVAVKRLEDGIRTTEATAKAILASIESVDDQLSVAKQTGAMKSELPAALAVARAGVHSLDFAAIESTAKRLEVTKTKAEKIADEVKDHISERKILLVPILVVFGGIGSAILLSGRLLARRRQKKEGAAS